MPATGNTKHVKNSFLVTPLCTAFMHNVNKQLRLVFEVVCFHFALNKKENYNNFVIIGKDCNVGSSDSDPTALQVVSRCEILRFELQQQLGREDDAFNFYNKLRTTMSCRVSTDFTGPHIPHNFSFGASVICSVHPKTTLEGKITPTCARSTKKNLVGTQGLSSGYNLLTQCCTHYDLFSPAGLRAGGGWK
jgi:hypothetical protein